MLPALENIPHTETDWLFFAWNHRDSHDRIRQAINQKYGVLLTDYQIEPINPNNVPQFLQNNQQLHADFSNILKLVNYDLQDVDFKDERQLQSWIFLHYISHFDAENALGIG